MAMDLLLARHGQTDWNPAQRVMGRNAIGLNAKGIEQAKNLNRWLQNIPLDAVYISPMERAKETARIVLEGRPLLPVVEEEGVAEIDYGDWVGITFSELESQHPQEYNAYRFHPSTMQIPGGESVVAVQKRAVAAIEKIRAKHDGQKVLVISHADVIKAIIVYYLNLELDRLQIVGCDNGSLSVYRFGTPWGDRLVALNYFADIQKILPW